MLLLWNDISWTSLFKLLPWFFIFLIWSAFSLLLFCSLTSFNILLHEIFFILLCEVNFFNFHGFTCASDPKGIVVAESTVCLAGTLPKNFQVLRLFIQKLRNFPLIHAYCKVAATLWVISTGPGGVRLPNVASSFCTRLKWLLSFPVVTKFCELIFSAQRPQKIAVEFRIVLAHLGLNNRPQLSEFFLCIQRHASINCFIQFVSVFCIRQFTIAVQIWMWCRFYEIIRCKFSINNNFSQLQNSRYHTWFSIWA